MGHIDWIPIADLPEALKDGRRVLVWTDTRIDRDDLDYVEAACGGEHVIGPQFGRLDANGGDWTLELIGKPTHFAEINAPA
jgi:hypothetical protein